MKKRKTEENFKEENLANGGKGKGKGGVASNRLRNAYVNFVCFFLLGRGFKSDNNRNKTFNTLVHCGNGQS